MKLLFGLVSLLLFAFVGCSRSANETAELNRAKLEAKLNEVLQQMISGCGDPKDQAALKSAELFHGIQGLPMEVVGFSVPINGGTNHAKISFTMDHFNQTSVKTLAKEGNEDFQTAKSSDMKSPR